MPILITNWKRLVGSSISTDWRCVFPFVVCVGSRLCTFIYDSYLRTIEAYSGANRVDDMSDNGWAFDYEWGAGMAIGIGVGIAIGVGMDNIGGGIAIGSGLGAVFAISMASQGDEDC